MKLRQKRVYSEPSKDDGTRILIDRLWPRGLRKHTARIDHWYREIAPSTELRQWYAHDADKWPEFEKRYRRELDAKPELVAQLLETIGQAPATLLFGSKEEQLNNAAVLKRYLEERA